MNLTEMSEQPKDWPVIRLEPGGDLVTALPEEIGEHPVLEK